MMMIDDDDDDDDNANYVCQLHCIQGIKAMKLLQWNRSCETIACELVNLV